MKVKLLTSIVLGNNLGSYCIGEKVDFDEKFAKELIDCGYAVEIKDESVVKEEIEEEVKKEKPKTKKPRTSKAKSE